MNIELDNIRKDFPILNEKVNNKPLVYLDNAATTQKPQVVIDAISNYYTHTNSNIHRSAHTLASNATELYENSRDTIQKFLNAKYRHEINFTRGTTEGINLVMYSWAMHNIHEGDEIIISALEHHSNLVPWQQLCTQKKAKLLIIPINEHGELMMDIYYKQLSVKTKLVCCVHTSNSLGTINPVKDIIEKAHLFGAKVLIDGAQAVAHAFIDVQALDADFFVFSGHKLFGPTGIGVLYAKESILNEMNPFHYGGEMIKTVSYETTTFNDLPYKFEAGTPNIAGVIGLGVAIKYVESVGFEFIQKQETALLQYATEKIQQINGLRIIGTAKNKASVISFVIENIHTYDIGVLLDKMGIAIRTGHHCCMPLMDSLSLEGGTCRASFSFYNTKEEVDSLISGLERVVKMI